MTHCWALLLAQSTQPTSPQPSGDPLLSTFIPIILMVVVFYWIMSRGNRKERQKYQDMINSLKRNDRVQTIGGILGTVVEVRDQEIVLKVDETNNVKLRVTRGAIKERLAGEAEGEGASGKDAKK